MTLIISLIITVILIGIAIFLDYKFSPKKTPKNKKTNDYILIQNEENLELNQDENSDTNTDVNLDNTNTYSEIEYKENFKKGIIAIVIYYGLSIIGSLLLQFILHPYVIKDLKINVEELVETNVNFNIETYNLYINYLSAYLNFIIFAITVVSLILLFKNDLIKELKQAKSSFKKYIIITVCGFIAMYVVNYITNIFIIIFFGDDFVSTNQSGLNDIFALGGVERVLFAFFVVIFAPIVEELVFRKSLFNLFKKHEDLATILSAVIFAGIHVLTPALNALMGSLTGANDFSLVFTELTYFIVYIGPALVLSLVYRFADKNVIPCIIIHVLQNLLSFIGMMMLFN